MMRRDIINILMDIYVSQRDIRLLLPAEALVYAKKEIDHAPLVNEDPNLYAPLFRNISVFKRYSNLYFFKLWFVYLFIVLLLNSFMIAVDSY